MLEQVTSETVTVTLIDVLAQALSPGEVTDIGAFIDARGIRSFVEAGVLTRDDGLVVTFEDGSEFQITVVQSR